MRPTPFVLATSLLYAMERKPRNAASIIIRVMDATVHVSRSETTAAYNDRSAALYFAEHPGVLEEGGYVH